MNTDVKNNHKSKQVMYKKNYILIKSEGEESATGKNFMKRKQDLISQLLDTSVETEQRRDFFRESLPF